MLTESKTLGTGLFTSVAPYKSPRNGRVVHCPSDELFIKLLPSPLNAMKSPNIMLFYLFSVASSSA